MALEKFCLCCKLRNGAVIWGCLCIIGSLITLIVTVSSDMFVERVTTEILYDNVVNNGNIHHSHFNYDTLKTPVYWVVVASSSINVLLSMLLVIGAVKVPFLKTLFLIKLDFYKKKTLQRNHFLMLPWIIVYGIVMIPFAIATFLLLITGLPICKW